MNQNHPSYPFERQNILLKVPGTYEVISKEKQSHPDGFTRQEMTINVEADVRFEIPIFYESQQDLTLELYEESKTGIPVGLKNTKGHILAPVSSKTSKCDKGQSNGFFLGKYELKAGVHRLWLKSNFKVKALLKFSAIFTSKQPAKTVTEPEIIPKKTEMASETPVKKLELTGEVMIEEESSDVEMCEKEEEISDAEMVCEKFKVYLIDDFEDENKEALSETNTPMLTIYEKYLKAANLMVEDENEYLVNFETITKIFFTFPPRVNLKPIISVSKISELESKKKALNSIRKRKRTSDDIPIVAAENKPFTLPS